MLLRFWFSANIRLSLILNLVFFICTLVVSIQMLKTLRTLWVFFRVSFAYDKCSGHRGRLLQAVYPWVIVVTQLVWLLLHLCACRNLWMRSYASQLIWMFLPSFMMLRFHLNFRSCRSLLARCVFRNLLVVPSVTTALRLAWDDDHNDDCNNHENAEADVSYECLSSFRHFLALDIFLEALWQGSLFIS